jgi:exodeoxyribonuclease-3
MTARVATYNLFEGAGGSYNRLVEFVREARLDVLCLQEVNGWQNNDFARLKDFADKILFASWAYGNSNTEYKLATVSKHKILGQTLHAEAFWHAVLEVRLQLPEFGGQEISIYNVHLDPWQETSRAKEIARLLATIDPQRPAIITGDLNSLSRQDNYPPELLAQLQAKGISKFGTNALELGVIDQLLQAGFIDAAAAAGNFQPTVPSAFSTDQAHEVPVRVDYIFVSPALAPYVKQVELLKSDLTDAISDHYPLVVTLESGVDETTTSTETADTATPIAQSDQDGSLAVRHDDSAAEPVPATPPPPKPAPKPWVPPDEPDTPQDKDTPAPSPPPEDGEVVMWKHNS